MSFRRLFQSGLSECLDAIRSRRAIVVLVLYFAASLLSMSGSIALLGKVEKPVSDVLQLETSETERKGVVSAALWKSRKFQHIVRGAIRDTLVYDDICGKHPAELLYAWFAFLFVPLVTILVGANRVADDLRSGAVRYMITRVTRLEWSLGKYLGLSGMLLAGLLVGGLAGWCVAAVQLGGADIAALLPSMLGWSVRAWFLSLAWLGFALGISHFFQSGAKATAMCVIAYLVLTVGVNVLTILIDHGSLPSWLAVLCRIDPGEHTQGLWRQALMPLGMSAVNLLMLGLLYLSGGYAVFARKDAR